MGRTKRRLPPRSKSEREFDHEIGNIVFVLNAIDAGHLDHLFVDAETKAAVRADWMAKGEAVVRKYVRAWESPRQQAPHASPAQSGVHASAAAAFPPARQEGN
jgi:hypothetical protein